MANAPYYQGTVTVGSTATLIASPGDGTGLIAVQNTGSVAVTLGGSNVTTAGATAGITLPGTMTSPVLLPSARGLHDLYGICASSTTVAFLYPA
jgi:hypothetical protein